MNDLAKRREQWYEQLDLQIANQARSAALLIHEKLKRSAEDIVIIGKELVAVKDQLPHGKWGEWLDLEFSMSEWTARRFMNVAERFGDKSGSLPVLPATVLYALAAPSTSDVVVDAALEQADAGEPVTEDDVQDLKRADEELKAERALYTQTPDDVRERAVRNRAREDVVRKAAEAPAPPPKPPEPKPLTCPSCKTDAGGLWLVSRSQRRGGGNEVQCRACNHRWWSYHEDAADLEDRPALKLEKPPEPEPEPPTIVVTLRIQPGPDLVSRKCMIGIGEENAMPQLSSSRYADLLDVLAGLLEEHVGRVEPVGQFIDAEVVADD